MERLKIALHLVHRSLWVFIVGFVMQAIGAVAFFVPTLNSSVLGIDRCVWVILGLLLFTFGVLWTASNEINDSRGTNKALDIRIEPYPRYSSSEKGKVIEFRFANMESSAITNCVAHLTEFEYLSGTKQSITLPVTLSFVGNVGLITIQRDGYVTLRLASRKKGVSGFELAGYPNAVFRQFSENKIKIQINGQVNGIDRIPAKIAGRLRMSAEQDLEFVSD